MRSRHLILPAVALASLVANVFVGALSVGANSSPRTYLIGVDAAGPTGNNFEYVDFFPRGQVLPTDPQAVVSNGTVLDFRYNLGSLDGLHTATLLPFGETPGQAWQQQPLVTGDEQESAAPPHVIFNSSVLFQQDRK